MDGGCDGLRAIKTRGRPFLSPTGSKLWARIRLPVAVVVTLFWIGSTAWMVSVAIEDEPFDLPGVKRELKPGTYEYVALYKGRQVGTTATRIRNSAGDWLVENETSLSGVPLVGNLEARTSLVLSNEMVMKSLKAKIRTSLGSLEADGDLLAGGSFRVRVHIGDKKVSLTVPKGSIPAVAGGLLQSISVRDLMPGRAYNVPILDLGTGTRIDVSVEVTDVEPKPDGRLYHLSLRYGGGPPLKAQVNEYGEVLMQELPYGVMLVRRGAGGEDD